jgi:hypothetical protein
VKYSKNAEDKVTYVLGYEDDENATEGYSDFEQDKIKKILASKTGYSEGNVNQAYVERVTVLQMTYLRDTGKLNEWLNNPQYNEYADWSYPDA